MAKKAKSPVGSIVAAVILAGVAFSAGMFLSRSTNSHRIVINKFDSKDAVKNVEYGSKDFNLAVSSAARSEAPFGRSLKLTLKLIPGSYNFVAAGQGLIDKKCEWENRPTTLDWNDVIGISYKVFIAPVRGVSQTVDFVKVATDVIDGDGEILRASKLVRVGEWIEERVYFKELVTRYDYQRDWKAVKWTGAGDEKTSLSRVDNGVKSYQFEIVGVAGDAPVDIVANKVEVDMYLDEVALIRR